MSASCLSARLIREKKEEMERDDLARQHGIFYRHMQRGEEGSKVPPTLMAPISSREVTAQMFCGSEKKRPRKTAAYPQSAHSPNQSSSG